MSVIVFPLALAASAVLGWRRRSVCLLALAGLPGLASLLWHFNLLVDVQSRFAVLVQPHALAWLFLSIGVPWAGALALSGLRDRRRPARSHRRVPDMRGVHLVVGRVLDTHDSGTAWHVPHGNWLHDLNAGVHVNHRHLDGLQAWPGHVIGLLHCRGRCLLGMNFSTGIVRPVRTRSAGAARSLVWTLMLMLLGGIAFPLLMLMSVLVWGGVLNWPGNGGLYTRTVVPGSHRVEACLTYGGGLMYGLFIACCLSSQQAAPLSGGAALAGALLLGLLLFGLHRYVLRTCARLHEQVLRHGAYQLKDLHEQGMARQAPAQG